MTKQKSKKKFTYFEDDFLIDLDSVLSADIKCCKNCYNDFVNNWPLAIDILKHSDSIDPIDPIDFYRKSNLLRNNYTENEYQDNLYKIKCPRCGSDLDGDFWAFEVNFDNFDELEYDFNVLKQDIFKTPFMVLKNELAVKTFELIESISKEIKPKEIKISLCRGRIINNINVNNSDLLPPPQDKTKEGRYNHLGVPVLYAATNEITCYNELRKPNKNVYIAHFEVNSNLKLLDLTSSEGLDEFKDSDLLKAIVLSSVASAKANDSSNYKPEYYFTRYISDCCKFLRLDGIVYPSVHTNQGYNYAFFDTNLINEDNIVEINKFN